MITGKIRKISRVLAAAGAMLLPAELRAFKGLPFVIDGDTLIVKNRRIRIFGIDAPEMGQSQGPHAKSALFRLVQGKHIRVKPLRVDGYGRTVAEVSLDDGRDVGAVMVQTGYARAALRFSRRYLEAERFAKKYAKGFWARGGIQNPLAYRERQRAQR